jgi:hypothetical protein
MNRNTAKAINWLLEAGDPGVRYLALRDLIDADVKDLNEAGKQAHQSGPIARVLSEMHSEGYWVAPGAGYYPKYTGTVWSAVLLAQLGAVSTLDERISTACSYVLDHALTEGGQFTVNGLASGTADCLQGNLCAALLDLGCRDTRLDKAFEWMARSVTGEGVAPMADKKASLRYYAGKCGTGFACGSNNKLPCAWGAVKVMLAFGKLPEAKKTPLINEAITAGTAFLFSTEPASAAYPCGYNDKPSGNWWKFGFPVFYVTDLLQLAESLIGLGYGDDPRLEKTMRLITEKQDDQGRWAMEYDYNGKTCVDFGVKKQPDKWVTLRALRVLQAWSGRADHH